MIDYPANSNELNNRIKQFNEGSSVDIDALVGEYEFWNQQDKSAAFDYYIEMLNKMNLMKENSGTLLAVDGIKQVDVYLKGFEGTLADQIFSNTQIDEDATFNLYKTKCYKNMVDYRADNVFISAYRYSLNSNDLLRDIVAYEVYEEKSKLLIELFDNDNTVILNGDITTVRKLGTKIFPIFHAGKSTITINQSTTTLIKGYTGDYFFNDPLLINGSYNGIGYNPDPTLSSSYTPNEFEQVFYQEYLNDINTNVDLTRDNIINAGASVWYKYQFLAPSISLPLYTSNNILFSSNPTIVCNTSVIFDYSGPNEDGIEYTWNFDDGTPEVTGTTSATDQLATSESKVHTYAVEDSYTVSLTLKYPSGCSYTYSKEIDITFPALPTLSFATGAVSGCDATNGSATVTVPNETIESCVWTTTEGQSFNSPTGQSSSAINNLSSNTYFVTITTANGCELSGSVGIPNNMAVSVANGFEINTNTPWNTPKNLKGVVKINNGATLTIDGTTVEFAYDVITLNDEGNELEVHVFRWKTEEH